MKCPICKQDALHAWTGTYESLGITLDAVGRHCDSCGETIFTSDECRRQDETLVVALVARGIRFANEFALVRKHAGLTGVELAELLDVRPETISRWEHGEVEIPRAAAFALGELHARPRVTRRKLETFSTIAVKPAAVPVWPEPRARREGRGR